MRSTLCFLFLVLTFSTARADLGENLGQCRARYGEMVDRKLAPNVDEMVLFKQDGFKIGAGMRDDKCVILIFGKESSDKLTDTEVETLLKSNGEDMTWKKTTAASGNLVWTRADNLVVAQLSSFGILTFVSASYMKTEMAKRSAAAGG